MDPLGKFLDFIEEEQLISSEDKLLLAVSGGKDSVFMVRLFAQTNFHFAIAHCNFQLRGAAADQDAEFVKNLAESLNVPFFSTQFDTKAFAEEKQISIQMAARDLRYAWLEEVRESNSYDYIAVAHHQTDSVETVLINMVRGTGIAGLHGILPKRERIIRPILAFTAEEVADYIHSNGIAYREDRSNKETKYARNKIRLEVLPVLKEINPSLEATFFSSSKRFYALEHFLDRQITSIRKDIFIDQERGVFHIPINLLEPYLPDQFLLFELFKPFAFLEPVLKDLSQSMIQAHTGRLFYSGTHQILIDRDKLILREIQKQDNSEFYIEALPAEFTWKEKKFRASYSADIDISRDPNQVKIDAHNVILPIEVRSWRNRDYFMPLGLKGRKKVSDFLINQKVPLDEKEEIPLFVNANKDILWIAPYRIDERYKISEKTKKVIIFEQL